MKFKKINGHYVIRLEKGEKILENLKDFCNKNQIRLGYFLGIGALDKVELALYIPKNKKYNFEMFKQPLEIINLSGNITNMRNYVG